MRIRVLKIFSMSLKNHDNVFLIVYGPLSIGTQEKEKKKIGECIGQPFLQGKFDNEKHIHFSSYDKRRLLCPNSIIYTCHPNS